jgi:hypothetical protein
MVDWTSRLADFLPLAYAPAAWARYFLGSKSSTVSTICSPGRARALSFRQSHDAPTAFGECLENARISCSGLHPEMLLECLTRDRALDVATIK